MKMIKIILILVLLFGISFSVCGRTGSCTTWNEWNGVKLVSVVECDYDDTLEIDDWDDMSTWKWIPIESVPYKESGNYIAELEEKVEKLEEKIEKLEEEKWLPKTLESWFKDLTLSQKVAIYFLVEGDKDVDYKENCIEIPWTIELYSDADSPDMSKDATGDDVSKYAN